MTLQGVAIPYICTFFATLVLGRSADRLRELRWHLVIPALIAAGGFVAGDKHDGLNRLPLCGCCGHHQLRAALLVASDRFSRRHGPPALPGNNSVGNLAGFLGPFLVSYLKDLTGSNSAGCIFSPQPWSSVRWFRQKLSTAKH